MYKRLMEYFQRILGQKNVNKLNESGQETVEDLKL